MIRDLNQLIERGLDLAFIEYFPLTLAIMAIALLVGCIIAGS